MAASSAAISILPSAQQSVILDPDGRVVIRHKRGQGEAVETRAPPEGAVRLDPPGSRSRSRRCFRRPVRLRLEPEQRRSGNAILIDDPLASPVADERPLGWGRLVERFEHVAVARTRARVLPERKP